MMAFSEEKSLPVKVKESFSSPLSINLKLLFPMELMFSGPSMVAVKTRRLMVEGSVERFRLKTSWRPPPGPAETIEEQGDVLWL
jgi:hypothetical protein